MSTTDPLYVTAAEAADITRIPEPTLRHYRHKNAGPPSVKIGRRVMYRLDDLRHWLRQQESATRRGDDLHVVRD